MSMTFLDPIQVNVFPGRTSRKQSHPHRAPSNEDMEVSCVFTIDFGMNGSHIYDLHLQCSGCNIPLNSNVAVDSTRDSVSPRSETHLMSQRIPDEEHAGRDRISVHSLIETHSDGRSASGSASPPPPTSVVVSSPEIQFSLANQYLDTMVKDEFWRAACRKRILQAQRKQHALKRSTRTSTKPLRNSNKFTGSSPQTRAWSKRSSPVRVKSKDSSSVSVKRQKAKFSKRAPSTRGSDSGFVSASPTPNPPTHLRVRSTRNYPVDTSPTTISVDIPASMVGRSCLSCQCTSTTCWRRNLGGIICNSCGLRYKKCGIICANPACRYIPTRSEIHELEGSGTRMERCYRCKGDIIVREDVVEHLD